MKMAKDQKRQQKTFVLLSSAVFILVHRITLEMPKDIVENQLSTQVTKQFSLQPNRSKNARQTFHQEFRTTAKISSAK